MSSSTHRLRSVMAAIRSAPVEVSAGRSDPRAAQQTMPFVTISRQAGAGGTTLAEQLVERLNHRRPRPQWHCFDRQLVEKVANDHKIAESLIEQLESSAHSWVESIWAGLPGDRSDRWLDEDEVYRRVATTIRSLAQRGHCVIVGRGGAYITQRLEGGVHVRLVAPLAYRIDQFAAQHQLTRREAGAEVRRIDRNREAFYRRYWPREMLDPIHFTATFNTADLTEPRLIDAVTGLLGTSVVAMTSP